MKYLCNLMLAVILVGCAAPRMNTASGRPEVTIAAERSQVKRTLATQLVNKHWQIISDSEMTLVADNDAGAWADFWFTNTLTGERPRNRVRFSLIEDGSKTRVVASAGFAHAPGLSGRAAEEEHTNRRIYQELQWFLDCVAANVEHRDPPPKPEYPKVEARSPKDQK